MKTILRENEIREKNLDLLKHKASNQIFKILFKAKQQEQVRGLVDATEGTAKNEGGTVCRRKGFDRSQYHNDSSKANDDSQAIGGQLKEKIKGYVERPNDHHKIDQQYLALEFGQMFSEAREERAAFLQQRMEGIMPQAAEPTSPASPSDGKKPLGANKQAQSLPSDPKRLLEIVTHEREHHPDMVVDRDQETARAIWFSNLLLEYNNDLPSLNNQDFQHIVQDEPGVLEEVGFSIRERMLHQRKQKGKGADDGPNQKEVNDVLKLIDRNMFVNLRDNKLTLDQVHARLSQTHHGVSYKVLDDIRPRLNPIILNGPIQTNAVLKQVYNKKPHEEVSIHELIHNHDPWLTNKRCRRSILGVKLKPREKEARKRMSLQELRILLKYEQQDETGDLSPMRVLELKKQSYRIATKIVKKLSGTERKLLNSRQKAGLVNQNIFKMVDEGMVDMKRKTGRRANSDDPKEKDTNIQIKMLMRQIKYKVKSQFFPPQDATARNKDQPLDAKEKLYNKKIYEQMKFLKRQEMDSGSDKVIWNPAFKAIFEDMDEQHEINMRRQRGLPKKPCEDSQQYSDRNQKEHCAKKFSRKPRPKDIMNENVMMGKYGPQKFEKKDYLGSHLIKGSVSKSQDSALNIKPLILTGPSQMERYFRKPQVISSRETDVISSKPEEAPSENKPGTQNLTIINSEQISEMNNSPDPNRESTKFNDSARQYQYIENRVSSQVIDQVMDGYDDLNDQIEILDDHQGLLKDSKLDQYKEEAVEDFKEADVVKKEKVLNVLENENINPLSLESQQAEDEVDEFKRMKEDFNSMNSLSASLALHAIIGKASDVGPSEQRLTSPGGQLGVDLSGGPFGSQQQKVSTGTFQQVQQQQILSFESSAKMQGQSLPSVNADQLRVVQTESKADEISKGSRASNENLMVTYSSLPPRPVFVQKQGSKVSVGDIQSQKSFDGKSRGTHKKKTSNLSSTISREPSIKNYEPIQLSTRKPYLMIQENKHGWQNVNIGTEYRCSVETTVMPPLPEEETVLDTGRGSNEKSNNNRTKIMEHSTFYISNKDDARGSGVQNTGHSVDEQNYDHLNKESVAPTERRTEMKNHLSPVDDVSGVKRSSDFSHDQHSPFGHFNKPTLEKSSPGAFFSKVSSPQHDHLNIEHIVQYDLQRDGQIKVNIGGAHGSLLVMESQQSQRPQQTLALTSRGGEGHHTDSTGENASSVQHTGRQPVNPRAVFGKRSDQPEVTAPSRVETYADYFPEQMGFQQIKSVQNINFTGNVFTSDPTSSKDTPAGQRTKRPTTNQFSSLNPNARLLQKNRLLEVFSENADYLSVFQRGIDLNEPNEETLKYLLEDNNQLFSKRDLPFLKDTLMQLGSSRSSQRNSKRNGAPLFQIQSTNPNVRKFDNKRQTLNSDLGGQQQIYIEPQYIPTVQSQIDQMVAYGREHGQNSSNVNSEYENLMMTQYMSTDKTNLKMFKLPTENLDLKKQGTLLRNEQQFTKSFKSRQTEFAQSPAETKVTQQSATEQHQITSNHESSNERIQGSTDPKDSIRRNKEKRVSTSNVVSHFKIEQGQEQFNSGPRSDISPPLVDQSQSNMSPPMQQTMQGMGIRGKTMKQNKRRNQSANPVSKKQNAVREKVKLLADQKSLKQYEYDKAQKPPFTGHVNSRPRSRTKIDSGLGNLKDSFNRDIPENLLVSADSEAGLNQGKKVKVAEFKQKKQDDMITTMMKQRLHRQRASAEKQSAPLRSRLMLHNNNESTAFDSKNTSRKLSPRNLISHRTEAHVAGGVDYGSNVEVNSQNFNPVDANMHSHTQLMGKNLLFKKQNGGASNGFIKTNRSLKTAKTSIRPSEKVKKGAFPQRKSGLGPQRTQVLALKSQHQSRLIQSQRGTVTGIHSTRNKNLNNQKQNNGATYYSTQGLLRQLQPSASQEQDQEAEEKIFIHENDYRNDDQDGVIQMDYMDLESNNFDNDIQFGKLGINSQTSKQSLFHHDLPQLLQGQKGESRQFEGTITTKKDLFGLKSNSNVYRSYEGQRLKFTRGQAKKGQSTVQQEKSDQENQLLQFGGERDSMEKKSNAAGVSTKRLLSGKTGVSTSNVFTAGHAAFGSNRDLQLNQDSSRTSFTKDHPQNMVSGKHIGPTQSYIFSSAQLNPEGGLSKKSNQQYTYQSKRKLELGDPSITEGPFQVTNKFGGKRDVLSQQKITSVHNLMSRTLQSDRLVNFLGQNQIPVIVKHEQQDEDFRLKITVKQKEVMDSQAMLSYNHRRLQPETISIPSSATQRGKTTRILTAKGRRTGGFAMESNRRGLITKPTHQGKVTILSGSENTQLVSGGRSDKQQFKAQEFQTYFIDTMGNKQQNIESNNQSNEDLDSYIPDSPIRRNIDNQFISELFYRENQGTDENANLNIQDVDNSGQGLYHQEFDIPGVHDTHGIVIHDEERQGQTGLASQQSPGTQFRKEQSTKLLHQRPSHLGSKQYHSGHKDFASSVHQTEDQLRFSQSAQRKNQSMGGIMEEAITCTNIQLPRAEQDLEASKSILSSEVTGGVYKDNGQQVVFSKIMSEE